MEISRNWRLQKQRYGLVGEVCPQCDAKMFPPRDVCLNCNGECKTPFAFSGRGEVYSFTTIYDPPEGFEDNAPYTVAIIKLEEGPMVTAQLTDVNNNDVEIGLPVEMVTRFLYEEPGSDGDRGKGMIVYGYKFRPVLQQT